MYRGIVSTYIYLDAKTPVPDSRDFVDFATEDELKAYLGGIGGLTWWRWRIFLWRLDKNGIQPYIPKVDFPQATIVVRRTYR